MRFARLDFLNLHVLGKFQLSMENLPVTVMRFLRELATLSIPTSLDRKTFGIYNSFYHLLIHEYIYKLRKGFGFGFGCIITLEKDYFFYKLRTLTAQLSIYFMSKLSR